MMSILLILDILLVCMFFCYLYINLLTHFHNQFRNSFNGNCKLMLRFFCKQSLQLHIPNQMWCWKRFKNAYLIEKDILYNFFFAKDIILVMSILINWERNGIWILINFFGTNWYNNKYSNIKETLIIVKLRK